MSTITPATTGLDLKLRRVRHRVRVIDLAAAMEVSHARISQIESLAVVTPQTTQRYLAALATLLDVSDLPIEASA